MNYSRLAVALLVLLAACSNLQAATHHSTEGFTVTVPDSWMQIPDATVQDMALKTIPGVAQKKRTIDSGFQIKGGDWFKYPYVLVQVIPYPPGKLPTEKDMQAMVAQVNNAGSIQTTQASPEIRELIKKSKFSATPLDIKTKSYVITSLTDIPGLGQLKGTASSHFGRNAAVQVWCYDLAANYPSHEADFRSISDSFKFDKEAAYPEFDLSEKIGQLVGFVLGAAIVVAGIFYFRARAKRRQSAVLGNG